jgi:hypothetical protein
VTTRLDCRVTTRLRGRPAADQQMVWIGFGGRADQWWLRLLRPGFRHCVAALRDGGGWLVAEPLSGRLVLARLDVPAAFDLPRFWRRAGLTVLGPFLPRPPRASWRPALRPLSCVGVCLALLGRDDRVLTPHGLFRALCEKSIDGRKNILTAES